MRKTLIASALMIAASAALLLAHGNATHIMGTVTAVDDNHLTVKTQEGKSETIMLEKTTKYLTGSKAAALGDLKVGARVVVDAKMDAKMKMYKAEEIKIGAAPAAKTEGKAKKSAK
jgi:hypothetical protein